MTEEVTTTEIDPVEEADGPKQLREALKSEKAKTAKLTTQLMGRAYKEAKLDTKTGLGKAIAKEYKGEPTTEALLAFAKEEYGYALDEDPENLKAPAIKQGQAQLDDVNTSSKSVTPTTESDALTKAEAEGDFVTAGAIKAAQLARMFQR